MPAPHSARLPREQMAVVDKPPKSARKPERTEAPALPAINSNSRGSTTAFSAASSNSNLTSSSANGEKHHTNSNAPKKRDVLAKKRAEEEERQRLISKKQSAAGDALREALREQKRKAKAEAQAHGEGGKVVEELYRSSSTMLTKMGAKAPKPPAKGSGATTPATLSQTDHPLSSDSDSDTSSQREWRPRKQTKWQNYEEELKNSAFNPEKLAEAERRVQEHYQKARQRKAEAGQKDYVKKNQESVVEKPKPKPKSNQDKATGVAAKRREQLAAEQQRKEGEFKLREDRRLTAQAFKSLPESDKSKLLWTELICAHMFASGIHGELMEHYQAKYQAASMRRAMQKIKLVLPFWMYRRRERKKWAKLRVLGAFMTWLGRSKIKHKAKKAQIIRNVLTSISAATRFVMHVRYWLMALRKLQRVVRHFLATRKVQLIVLRKQWDKHEIETIARLTTPSAYAAGRKGSSAPEGLKGLTPCPDHTKNAILLMDLRMRVGKHLQNIRVWEKLMLEKELASQNRRPGQMPAPPKQTGATLGADLTPRHRRVRRLSSVWDVAATVTAERGSTLLNQITVNRPQFRTLHTDKEIVSVIENFHFDRQAFISKYKLVRSIHFD